MTTDRRPIPVGPLMLLVGAAVVAGCERTPPPHVWSENEVRTIRSLSLAALPPLPPDPSNAVGDDPRAVALGHRLYFDAGLSANGEVSCASCHKPELKFTDGLPLGKAIGTTRRHTPTVVGAAYHTWFFWDGRRDSLWAQAITPLEDPAEHGGTRTQYAHRMAEAYGDAYAELFGPLPPLSASRFPARAGPLGNEPERAAWESMSEADRRTVDRIYANLGKSIAAYERRILHGPSPFDAYADALAAGDEAAMREALDDEAAQGLRLFVGRANCTQCHNGPLLTNGGFHNIGLPLAPDETFDAARTEGAREVQTNPFNCRSEFSDAPEDVCDELRFVKPAGAELLGAHKVPSLRNVADTAPYMHRGQLATLTDVLAHYDRAPAPVMGHSDLVPLKLSDREMGQLESFLRSLSGPVAAPPELLRPPNGDVIPIASKKN